MGNSQHLKRHTAPTAWPIKRKNITFIAKPNPGSHKSKYVVPMVVMLRDVLKYAETSKEVKLILNNEEVLVNGKRIKEFKFPIGLFDVLEIKKTSEKFMVLFDEFGKVKLVPTKDNTLYMKILSKTVLPKGKFQLNLMNGFNILVAEKDFKAAKVEDTVVYDLDKKKVLGVSSLKKGAYVYVFDGNFKGKFGKVTEFEEYKGVSKDLVSIEIDGVAHKTAKDYCFALGEKKEDLKKFN